MSENWNYIKARMDRFKEEERGLARLIAQQKATEEERQRSLRRQAQMEEDARQSQIREHEISVDRQRRAYYQKVRNIVIPILENIRSNSPEVRSNPNRIVSFYACVPQFQPGWNCDPFGNDHEKDRERFFHDYRFLLSDLQDPSAREEALYSIFPSDDDKRNYGHDIQLQWGKFEPTAKEKDVLTRSRLLYFGPKEIVAVDYSYIGYHFLVPGESYDGSLRLPEIPSRSQILDSFARQLTYPNTRHEAFHIHETYDYKHRGNVWHNSRWEFIDRSTSDPGPP